MMENRGLGLQSKCDICTMKHSEIEVGLLIGKGCYNDVMELIGVEGSYVKQKNAEEQEECQQVSSPSPGSSRPASSKYVVKKIRYDLSKSSRNDAALSLSTEAKFLAAISHPNIISLHCLGDNPGCTEFFLVIDRLEIDLAQQIDRWKQKEEKLLLSGITKADKQRKVASSMTDRIQLAYEIASALVYLHDNEILFRDLKPENIGLTRDNHAKLFDFGLCKELKEGMKNIDGDYLCTQYMGTPRYMSPEVHNGRYYGLPADIYSFTLILWELMSLEMCFKEANSLPELVALAYGKKCSLPIKKSWPREARRLLQKGLNLDPLKRPNAIEIYEELHFYMRNEITSAVKPNRLKAAISMMKRRNKVGDTIGPMTLNFT